MTTLTRHATGTTTRRHRGGGAHRSTRPRTLHLLDLENLVDGLVTPAHCAAAWAEYSYRLGYRPGDHAIVAVSKKNALTAFLALPDVQRVIGPNRPDGADLALIDAVDLDWARTHFRQVVIASGDHIFTPLARRLADHGLFVVQAVGAAFTSAQLYHAVSTQQYLPELQRRIQQHRRSEHLRAVEQLPGLSRHGGDTTDDTDRD